MATSYKSKIYTTLGTPTNITTNLTPLSVSNSSGVPVKDYTVKGKSIVWNQLIKNGNFVDKTGWGIYNGTGSVSNNKYTLTAAGKDTYSHIEQYMDKSLFIVGHKYYITATITPQYSTGRLTVALHNGANQQPEAWTAPASSGKTNFVSTIFTPPSEFVSGATNRVRFILYCPHTQSAQGCVTEISNVWMVDLTKMFGSGNEPTAAQFRAMFPDDYYEYDAGTIKNIMPEVVETKNQSGETKRANIPSSKYFPDGMRSVGSAYDEINFLSQKAIKRIGVRAYQTGDENDANVMTDKINTVYILSTPVETAITPPLQALSTYKGFTSFSAPNSLMQNGPLSVTYYAEGGESPEKGWLTSYKRKLYMGRTIEWNQLFVNSATSSNGVTISNNQDGTMTLNGTVNKSYINFTNLSDAMNQAHKYLLCLKILNNPDNVSFCYKWLNRYLMRTSTISSGESCAICNQTADYIQLHRGNGIDGFETGTVFNDVKIAVMVMDLTQMFGAGNEPTTAAQFWQYFDHKYYPYNTGETQPLFKISRKRRWGSATPASLYVEENVVVPQTVRN